MANKKRRPKAASSTSAAPAQPQAQAQQPSSPVSAMQNSLRMIALLSATAVALLAFELLQGPLGFWPALASAFVAGVLARAALVWVERVWLRAATRRAQAAEARRAEQPRAQGKPASK